MLQQPPMPLLLARGRPGAPARARVHGRVARRAPAAVVGWLAVVAASLVACGTLSPSSEQDPCVLLGQVCEQCKRPQDVQNCQNATAAQDSAQCAAILDQSAFRADCVPPDGGLDAANDVEGAAPLPACGTQASADAGCACTGNACAPSCPGGGCAITCTSGNCAPTCAGGRCTVTCAAGAVCEGSCAGGDCIYACKGGSQCANVCPGGGCSFQCDNGSICNDSCGSASTCAGP